MAVFVLALLLATAATAAGLLVRMFRVDDPLLGGPAICLLVGPGPVLAFLSVGPAAAG